MQRLGLERQRRRAQQDGVGVGDRAQRLLVGGRLAGARGDDEQQRQAAHPPGDVRERAHRRRVGPLDVVDEHDERAAQREVRGQPVERVEHRERRVGHRRPGRDVDERGGEAGRAAQQLRALLLARLGQARLEELADDAERELALELAAARLEHRHLAGAREGRGRRDQPGLADARLALEPDHAARAVGGGLDGLAERRQLGVALEELGSSFRPHAATLSHGASCVEGLSRDVVVGVRGRPRCATASGDQEGVRCMDAFLHLELLIQPGSHPPAGAAPRPGPSPGAVQRLPGAAGGDRAGHHGAGGRAEGCSGTGGVVGFGAVWPTPTPPASPPTPSRRPRRRSACALRRPPPTRRRPTRSTASCCSTRAAWTRA